MTTYRFFQCHMGSYRGLHLGFSTNIRGEEPRLTMELCCCCCCSVIFFSHYFVLLPSSVPTSHTSTSCGWTDGGKHNYALDFRACQKFFFPYSDLDLPPTMMSTIHANPIAPFNGELLTEEFNFMHSMGIYF